MILTTSRLILRPFRENDFEAVHSYGSDFDVTRFTSFGPNTPEATREFLERCRNEAGIEPRTHYNFAVTLTGRDDPIGGVGFWIDHPLHRGAEMGYVFGKSNWGRGIATEAAGALLDFAFGVVGLHRIVARCHPDNAASARVMQKLGMTYEGRQREVMWLKGAWWDFLVYSMLEADWLARKGTGRPMA